MKKIYFILVSIIIAFVTLPQDVSAQTPESVSGYALSLPITEPAYTVTGGRTCVGTNVKVAYTNVTS